MAQTNALRDFICAPKTKTHARWVGQGTAGRHVIFKAGRIVRLTNEEAKPFFALGTIMHPTAEEKNTAKPAPHVTFTPDAVDEATREQWDAVVANEAEEINALIATLTTIDELKLLADAETRRAEPRKQIIDIAQERIQELMGRRPPKRPHTPAVVTP